MAARLDKEIKIDGQLFTVSGVPRNVRARLAVGKTPRTIWFSFP
jgi:hypothetical protein